MGQSASQSTKFFEDIINKKVVWTIKDDKGFPAPLLPDGKRSQPFWSTKSRVEIIIKNIKAYSSFQVYEIALDDFINKWIPGLKKDNILIGTNWSGDKAIGYDFEPEDVLKKIQYYLSK